MLKENSELRAEARQALQGKWPMAAVAALIYSIIAGGLAGCVRYCDCDVWCVQR